MVANHVLCQLSYTPKANLEMETSNLVGLGGFELPTSPLSGVRSNQLSYRPAGLLLQNKGYKFSPVASIWFCSTVPAIEFVKNKSDLSKLDRRKPSRSSRELHQQKFAAPALHRMSARNRFP